jgi:flagellin
MIGSMSSSLALAQRTASTARATMDTMARQIATGQKVSSVKDNGAVWAQAAGLESQKVGAEARGYALGRIQSGLGFTEATLDLAYQALEKLSQLTIAARSAPVGSTARQALAAEWNQVTEWTASANAGNPDWVYTASAWDQADYNNFGWDLGGTDPMLGGGRWAVMWNAGSIDGWVSASTPVALRGFDLANANSAQLDQAFAAANNMLNQARGRWGISVGADQRRLETLTDITNTEIDRLDAGIGSLTDADLGKASTARAQAETRQQLALETIKSAISAYGNFAGGLLGNVQRTQRGVLA